jgi:hypothetical protein
MTVKEFIKKLNQFDDEAVIEIEFLSVNVGASYSAEPKLVQWGDKVKILAGRRKE